jgi:hypothetical protein
MCSDLRPISLSNDPRLIQIFFISRHGARTPGHKIPNLPCKWTLPEDELTTLGQQQHFQLGQYLRKTYPEIPQEYVPTKFYFRSSDEDRTLMSMQSNLMGLFEDLYNSSHDLPFQSFPIHSESRSYDWTIQGRKSCKTSPLLSVLFISSSLCVLTNFRAIDPIIDAIHHSSAWKDLETENQDVLNQITTLGGITSPSTLENISRVLYIHLSSSFV